MVQGIQTVKRSKNHNAKAPISTLAKTTGHPEIEALLIAPLPAGADKAFAVPVSAWEVPAAGAAVVVAAPGAGAEEAGGAEAAALVLNLSNVLSAVGFTAKTIPRAQWGC
jgi:hypothetical protein